jgi:hypothetical protein
VNHETTSSFVSDFGVPRAGLSWQLQSHTVLRAGLGMFQGFLGARRQPVIQSGFSQTTNMVPTIDNINFAATISNPFPNGITEPVGAAGGPQTYLGQNITFFNQNPLVPCVFRWEFGLQHELPGGFLVQADYVGTKSYRLEINRNLNALPDQYLTRSSSSSRQDRLVQPRGRFRPLFAESRTDDRFLSSVIQPGLTDHEWQ